MKKTILILFCLISTYFTYSQENKFIVGKISKEDIDYKVCPYDSTAEAVVLFDLGESRFGKTENGFNVLYERTTRIKILNQSGINWANLEIPLYQSNNVFETVIKLEAIAYNFENGVLSHSKLDMSNVHQDIINENWVMKKFAIPNVKPGTIIEYSYKIESEYIFNLRDWQFQWKIPVLFSQYKVSLVPFYHYTFLLQGASKFDEQTSVIDDGFEEQFGNVKYHFFNHKYVMKNIKAFKDEEFITSPDDYLIKLDFQLSNIVYPSGYKKDIITTWPLLIKDLLEEDKFGKYISNANKLAEKVFDLKYMATLTNKQKFDTVLNYMKKNFRWDNKKRIYASKSPKNFMTDKFGNSADINLFTIGLLNGIGVKTSPVIVSTRDHGKIKVDYPFLDFFNYVLFKADIDSTVILGDATSNLIPNNRIPLYCINESGLVVDKNNISWLKLNLNNSSKIMTNITLNINDTAIEANFSISAGEYDGYNFRKNFGLDTKEMKKYFSENNYTVDENSIVVKNMDLPTKPYILGFKSDFIPEIIDNKMYISPFFNEILKKNPFNQNSRTYPIDMIYSKTRMYNTNIPIPAGYKIDYLPVRKKISNAQIDLEYNATVLGENVLVSFYYQFKQPVYNASEFQTIKYYFNEIIRLGNEKIVFVK